MEFHPGVFLRIGTQNVVPCCLSSWKEAHSVQAASLEVGPQVPTWQGHVYYANVPAPVISGYTARPIEPFAATYQPPHRAWGC